MNIAVLTSSRADYGIYQPLLKRLHDDSFFELELIVFGTHLSKQFGYTVSQIENDGYRIAHRLGTLAKDDSADAIVQSMAQTTSQFSDLWKDYGHHYDMIFCLGDRYEMVAAVQAGLMFNLPFAHIHGGETSLGAVDNTFRHCLSLMSSYHFTSHQDHAARVKSLIGADKSIYTVGALSLDNLQDVELYTQQELLDNYDVDFKKPTILFTFHPETIRIEKNELFINEIVDALHDLSHFQLLITGTNADPGSQVIRDRLEEFRKEQPERVTYIESLGIRGYFSCIKHCKLMVGNTSSGIIEAASFGTYVLDLGNRQRGRIAGDNVFHAAIESDKISAAINRLKDLPAFDGGNIYWQGGAAKRIVQTLKSEYNG